MVRDEDIKVFDFPTEAMGAFYYIAWGDNPRLFVATYCPGLDEERVRAKFLARLPEWLEAPPDPKPTNNFGELVETGNILPCHLHPITP